MVTILWFETLIYSVYFMIPWCSKGNGVLGSTPTKIYEALNHRSVSSGFLAYFYESCSFTIFILCILFHNSICDAQKWKLVDQACMSFSLECVK
jgi:hypothetical protein